MIESLGNIVDTASQAIDLLQTPGIGGENGEYNFLSDFLIPFSVPFMLGMWVIKKIGFTEKK